MNYQRNAPLAVADAERRRTGWLAGTIACVLLFMPAAPAAAWPVSRPQQQSGFVVIVHADNPIASIDAGQLSKIFLKKIRQWETGDPIEVVEQRPSARVRGLFAEEVHRRSVAAVTAYWQQQIF